MTSGTLQRYEGEEAKVYAMRGVVDGPREWAGDAQSNYETSERLGRRPDGGRARAFENKRRIGLYITASTSAYKYIHAGHNWD